MIYRVFNINYCVEEEDLDLELPEGDFDEEDFDDFVESKINEIKSELPKSLYIELDFCEDECFDTEEELADAISDRTGWLVNSFDYEKVEVG